MIYVDKKRFLGMDLDKEDQLVDPTSYRNGLNMRISQEITDDGGVKSIPGNTRMDFTPPTGENKTVGTFEDGQKNRFIFFNWNGGGDHGIYYYDDSTKTFTTVINTSQLLFEKDLYITQIAVVENFLLWTDGKNDIKTVNLDFDYTDFDTKDINIDLHKPAPFFRPTTSVSTDSAKASNQVTADTWQFVYRYLYSDDSFSVFSPKSDLVFFEIPRPFRSQNNVINVQIADVADIPDDVVGIEWGYEKNNSGGVFIFKKDDVEAGYTGIVPFTNSGTTFAVSDSVSAKLFESIPNLAHALTLAKNRVFLANMEEGQPVDIDNGTDIVMTAAIQSAFTNFTVERTFKAYGTYLLGIVWHDDKTSSGVQYVENISIPEWTTEGTFPFFRAAKHSLTVSTAGIAPAWATRFSYVISEEGTYQQYQQFPVNVLYYFYDWSTAALAALSGNTNSFFIGNQQFLREAALTLGAAPAYLYLQIPKALAWVPDGDTYVRILRDKNHNPIEKIERVVQVTGNFLVTGTFGILQADLLDFFDGSVFIEVFKLKEADTEFFYESGGPYPIADLNNQKTVEGDGYVFIRLNETRFFFDKLDTYDIVSSSVTERDYPAYFSEFTTWSLAIAASGETSTPMLRELTDLNNPLVESISFRGVVLKNNDEVTTSFVGDLSRESYSKGRPFIVLENEALLIREETLRYSNKFVQASNINGLSNFESGNEYVLPSERSAIMSLVTVKNIALAIHIRETTSLYLNEKFMKASSGSDLNLVFTDDVIGQDRLLQGSGNFGTINPESVKEHDGHVFWWDAYNGAVLRYTNAGIYPISEYGMSSFFRTIGNLYLGATVVGGYDPKYDEYILTFSPIDDLNGFTISFDVRKERWVSFYSFQPENYAKLSNKFFSFVNGEVWQHDINPLYNNFYGQQYERELKFVSNAMVEKIKVYTNVHIDQEILSTDDTSGYEAVQLAGDGRESVITVADFVAREGLFRSHIFRNNLIEEGDTDYKQGEQMRGRTMELTVKTDRSDQSLLKSVNVLFHSSEYSN